MAELTNSLHCSRWLKASLTSAYFSCIAKNGQSPSTISEKPIVFLTNFRFAFARLCFAVRISFVPSGTSFPCRLLMFLAMKSNYYNTNHLNEFTVTPLIILKLLSSSQFKFKMNNRNVIFALEDEM